MMVRLTLLLFLIAPSFASTTPPTPWGGLILLVDDSKCVHLRCEWRGVGEHCKKSSNYFDRLNQQKTVPGATPLYYAPYIDDESTASTLARIQWMYPRNTFTVVNDDFALGEQCKGRRLWCNDTGMYGAKDFDTLLEIVKTHRVPPKFEQC